MENSSKMFELISKHVKIPDAASKMHNGSQVDALLNLLVEKNIFTRKEFENAYELECGQRVKELEDVFKNV
jgi:hypothetical protein